MGQGCERQPVIGCLVRFDFGMILVGLSEKRMTQKGAKATARIEH